MTFQFARLLGQDRSGGGGREREWLSMLQIFAAGSLNGPLPSGTVYMCCGWKEVLKYFVFDCRAIKGSHLSLC